MSVKHLPNNHDHLPLAFMQADLSHGAAQAGGATHTQCPVLQEPSEEAGCKGGPQTRVHRAEAQHWPAGEQKDEG